MDPHSRSPAASERREIQRPTGPWTATVRSSACSHPTLDVVVAGLLVEVVTLHLDRDYDSGAVCERLAGYQLTEFKVERRGTTMPGVKKHPVRLGIRWVVEATNTWSSDYARSAAASDRKNSHRHAALCRATAIPIVGRPITHRNRWSGSTA